MTEFETHNMDLMYAQRTFCFCFQTEVQLLTVALFFVLFFNKYKTVKTQWNYSVSFFSILTLHSSCMWTSQSNFIQPSQVFFFLSAEQKEDWHEATPKQDIMVSSLQSCRPAADWLFQMTSATQRSHLRSVFFCVFLTTWRHLKRIKR